MMKSDLKIREREALRSQVEELTNRWKRALADYQNLEKRYEKDKTDFVQFANANLILKFLVVLSHLKKAAEHLKDEGLNLVLNEFERVLQTEGIEEIRTLGEKFNPQVMEAVEVVIGGEKDRVAEELSKGYLLKGKVLLPAKVKVFQGGPEKKQEEKINEKK